MSFLAQIGKSCRLVSHRTTGAILIVIITILGPISGAHFNPAVTLVFASRAEFQWSEVTPYVVVQCLGGICGTVVAHLMFDLAPLAIGTTGRSGPSQWLAEAVATFTLVLAILGGNPPRFFWSPLRVQAPPINADPPRFLGPPSTGQVCT